MADQLVRWLREQIAEDRRIAEEACDGPWHVDDEGYAEAIYSADGTCVIGGGRWGGEASVFDSTEDALHVVRWDPARVLHEVEAKRRILDDYERYAAERRRAMGGWDSREVSPILTALALPYSNRPGYHEEWRP